MPVSSKYVVEIPIKRGVGDSIIVAISIGQSGIKGHCHCRGKIIAAIASMQGVKSLSGSALKSFRSEKPRIVHGLTSNQVKQGGNDFQFILQGMTNVCDKRNYSIN